MWFMRFDWQDEEGQWECKECPEGFYCDNAIEPVVNYTLYECPEGIYVYADLLCHHHTFSEYKKETKFSTSHVSVSHVKCSLPSDSVYMCSYFALFRIISVLINVANM